MDINLDRKTKTKPTDRSWQMCIGNDHAFQLHRSDVCEHLKLAHDELGFRYVRFHGLFDENDMLTIQSLSDFMPFPDADKIKEYNFRQVGHVLDNVLKCGLKPFVELSFMPKQLASGKKTGLHYKNNITPPKNYQAWANYIENFVRFILGRYGNEEVESWYFEVWNEPDIPNFWTSSQREYFKLYQVTALAIKRVNGNLRVGGPSTSACLWLAEFQDFCRQNHVPYDFVSTHHYPGDGFGNGVDVRVVGHMLKSVRASVKAGDDMHAALPKLFFSPEKAAAHHKGMLVEADDLAREKVPDKPLFITEWNSMAVFSAPVHDEKYSAAFVIKSVLDLDHQMDGYAFWCCSDIFEELFQLNKPFVGSFGIISNDGIPKPNFWAFKMLSQLHPYRLDLPIRTNADVEYAAFSNGQQMQVLVHAQSMDSRLDQKHDVELQINMTASKVIAQRIDDSHCNPKRMWQELGSPDNLTPQQVEDIKEKTKLKEEKILFENSRNSACIRFSLQTNDVIMLTIE